MAGTAFARKSLSCNELFAPDARNHRHQQFCAKPDCRKASKRESQRRWLSREENQSYFRGPENVARVQAWRRAHPGYWRRRAKKSARLNPRILNLLNRVRRKISPPLRYKISAWLNCLFCWALCISSSIHRYNWTSSLSPFV